MAIKNSKSLGKNHNTIFQRSLLTSDVYNGSSFDNLESEIQMKWKQFINLDLPLLTKIFRGQDWIWEKHHDFLVSSSQQIAREFVENIVNLVIHKQVGEIKLGRIPH